MHLAASKPEAFATPSARIGRRFALLWLAVALLFQGLVIQTHAHAGVDNGWTSTASSGVAPDSQRNTPVAPACLLCEEKALFGAYLVTGSITIAAPVDLVYHYAAPSLPLLALRPSSHAWRSRAPPNFHDLTDVVAAD
jgi:hypothetical protein